ncbi:phage tail sheath C-terminal domain-containing protein [Sorangium sp. So ce726]|uniref:phage tail sheath family protein n=1 Tax=Sorangium sp. So ce726 TaxID=3133319 RepID=UPI003F616E46
MSNAYLHPGVYVEELPGPQQVTGVGTSTTVFIGWTEQGPVNTPTLIDSWNAFTRTFGSFVFGRNVAFAVYNYFAEGGAIGYVVNATTSVPGSMLPAKLTEGDLVISAAAPGSWGNSLAILIENYPTENPPSGTPLPVFVLSVIYMAPTGTPTTTDDLVARYAQTNNIPLSGQEGASYWVVEQFPGLTAADMMKPTVTAVSGIESKINSRSLFIRVQVTDTAGARPSNLITPTPLQGGAGDLTQTPIDYATALATLDPLTDISLVVAPDTAMIDDLGKQRATVQEIISYCEARNPRDLFMIADAPYGLDVQDVTAFKTGAASPDGTVPAGAALNSSYGAIYYPWIDFFNGLTSISVPMPPSGPIAGTYAETDTRVGVWKAPAGIKDGKLASAVSLPILVTSADQDTLNPNGINAIRLLPRYGIVSYGARTLSLDPSLVYVNVRRLLTYIEMSLYWGTQWVVFEPNEQQLWGAVNRDVSQFLTQLWQAGGLAGDKESDAFMVQVNAANNPPESRNQGILYIDVSVAPVRPAEFVVIRIQQSALPNG